MKRTLLALLLITTLFFSFACERRGVPDQWTVATGPIVVGYYGDLSGRTSNFGQSTKNGVEMAADEINKAGGINGRKSDSFRRRSGRPEKAATVVTKLINQDQVHALLGEVASANSLAAAPNAQEAKVPMISPSSTNPAVTQVGDYIFRVCFIDPFQGEVMAKFAANTLKAKTSRNHATTSIRRLQSWSDANSSKRVSRNSAARSSPNSRTRRAIAITTDS